MSGELTAQDLNLTNAAAEKLAKALAAGTKELGQQKSRAYELGEIFKKVGNYQEVQAVKTRITGLEWEKIKDSTLAWAKSLEGAQRYNDKMLKDLEKSIDLEHKRVQLVNDYKLAIQEVDDVHSKTIDKLRAQGSIIKANAKDWAKGKFGLTEQEGAGAPGAGGRVAAKGTVALAQPGMANDFIKSLGPWGMLISMMISAADKTRKMGAELQQSAGATGEAGDGLARFTKIASGAQLQFGSISDALVGQMGMTAEEVMKDAGELAAAGIKVSDTLGANGGMTDQFQNLEGIALATGQGIGAVGKQFANIINTFRMTKGAATSAMLGLKNAANDIQKNFDVTTAEMMSSMQSIAEAAADMGVGIQGVADLFTTLNSTLAGTSVGLAGITKIAGSLANIGRSDKGWLAFMGKMGGGASGGFLGALGAAQQRGPGFMGPRMSGRELDSGKQVDMMVKAVSRATMGQSGAAKQYIKEQLYAQFGLDEQAAQAMNKMGSGRLSRAGAAQSLDKMKEDAKYNKMGMKGILDIIEGLIKKLIFAPLNAIMNFMSFTWGKGKPMMEATTGSSSPHGSASAARKAQSASEAAALSGPAMIKHPLPIMEAANRKAATEKSGTPNVIVYVGNKKLHDDIRTVSSKVVNKGRSKDKNSR
jgi:hypothetical protein